ncbi:MAG: peptidylprolyl isomerase [Wenzhouxiangella sp.]|jgi:peptidyl-prolyl cis-trans isomerase SurA|nr:peptidylprolyl isomerase [Wenzhouxiangella sp.]
MEFMRYSKFVIVALIIVLAFPLTGSAQQLRQELDSIVALVEEDVILRSELDAAINTIEMQVRARGENLPPRQILEEQVLERLIMTRLEVIRAQETGIRASDANIDQALQQVARQNGITVTQLRQAIEADGYDFEEFRRQIREEILSSELRQRVAASMDDITDTEVEIMLASGGIGGAEYNLSQILIQLPEDASGIQVREAEVRAEEIRQEVLNGMEFAEAAISYSQAPDALEGGNVGWRQASALPPIFSEALESLGPGEITEPIRSPGGFLLLRVNDKREQSEVIVDEYLAHHIMIEPSELLSIEEAEDRIRDLRQRIADGEDFSELARRYSTDESTANLGGLMNWFPAGQYGSDVQSALDALAPGEVSEPFRTASGWHIVRLDETREADRTEEAMRAQAREMIFQQKAEGEVERFLRQLRSESFVEIRL